ncbi:VOC family protein [Rhizorhabdus dicambivorans]|nr:VOC family protein [Rhizorhabdus dicambivorans]
MEDIPQLDRRQFMSLAGATLVGTAMAAVPANAAAKSSLAIDHVSLGVRDLFEGSARLNRETGITGIEGSWFPEGGMANRYFRTGNNTYIEVEAIIDPFAAETMITARHLVERLRGGDCFLGWVARVNTREELDEIAARLKSKVVDAPLGLGADGSAKPNYVRTPEAFTTWTKGLPNFMYWDGRPKPVVPGPTKPSGIAWLEIGGTQAAMRDWIGPGIENLPLKFNGKAPGVHAVGVESDRGIIEIRRRPLPL